MHYEMEINVAGMSKEKLIDMCRIFEFWKYFIMWKKACSWESRNMDQGFAKKWEGGGAIVPLPSLHLRPWMMGSNGLKKSWTFRMRISEFVK